MLSNASGPLEREWCGMAEKKVPKTSVVSRKAEWTSATRREEWKQVTQGEGKRRRAREGARERRQSGMDTLKISSSELDEKFQTAPKIQVWNFKPASSSSSSSWMDNNTVKCTSPAMNQHTQHHKQRQILQVGGGWINLLTNHYADSGSWRLQTASWFPQTQ